MPRALVILLHGVNARGRDMARIAPLLQLPDTVILAPDAPEASGESPGAKRWFSLDSISAQNRPERVRAARPGLDRVLGQAIAAYGLADRLHQVALLGFSQGAIMALDAVASGRWRLGAVAALSGRYATLDACPISTPALVLHGLADPAIPPCESRDAARCLTGLGAAVELQLLPGLAHWISDEAATRAGDFLRRHLGLDAPHPGQS